MDIVVIHLAVGNHNQGPQHNRDSSRGYRGKIKRFNPFNKPCVLFAHRNPGAKNYHYFANKMRPVSSSIPGARVLRWHRNPGIKNYHFFTVLRRVYIFIKELRQSSNLDFFALKFLQMATSNYEQRAIVIGCFPRWKIDQIAISTCNSYLIWENTIPLPCGAVRSVVSHVDA